MQLSRSLLTIFSAAVLLLAPGAAFAGGGVGCCTIGPNCSDEVGSQLCEMSGGTFVDGGTCTSTPIGTCEPPPTPTPAIACCERVDGCNDDAILMICVLGQGTFFPGEVCDTDTGNCITAPTATATATATSTPVANGGSCSTSTQCASTFCVDGVCCDSACEGTTERCDISGSEGECIALSATPAASNHGLAAMALLLCGIAGLALRRIAR